MWVNIGVLPFWLMLIIIPSSKITRIFVNSIILPLIIGSLYGYIIYQAVILNEPLMDVFKLYLSLDDLYTLFSIESFLLIFWLHFIAINLFLGSWVSSEGVKYNMPRGLIFLPLILIYFTGPIGLVFYWLIRIFYAKKIAFHD
tara:strand:+ start:113 stop:541 length:429 start_codon:yes stop_codon:yes gene_type:complete